MWKTFIHVKKDVQEDYAEKFQKSSEEEQPRIVLFTKEGKIEGANIVGDGIVVNMVESTIEYVLMVLICCYYVYDLAYPRKYCQFLGLMQHLVIEDPFLDTKYKWIPWVSIQNISSGEKK